MTTDLVAWCNHEVCRRDLSQGMRCTQTCATTQSEQTLLVPIEAPPFSGLRVNYNILKGNDGCASISLSRISAFPLLFKSALIVH